MKIRCSQIGKIMTDPKTKADKEAGKLSETTKSYCLELLAEKYGRKKDITSKYLEKGIAVEESSITLLSLLTKKMYRKNAERFSNDYLTGTPDLVVQGELLDDIKSSWDLNTFLKAKHSPINKMYYYQLQGYMALTGAKVANLRYCLVNATPSLIDDEKKRLFYALGTNESDEYKEGAKQIERNLIYDMAEFIRINPWYDLDSTDWDYDLPAEKRLHTITVYYDPQLIDDIYQRVERIRDYMETINI